MLLAQFRPYRDRLGQVFRHGPAGLLRRTASDGSNDQAVVAKGQRHLVVERQVKPAQPVDMNALAPDDVKEPQEAGRVEQVLVERLIECAEGEQIPLGGTVLL